MRALPRGRRCFNLGGLRGTSCVGRPARDGARRRWGGLLRRVDSPAARIAGRSPSSAACARSSGTRSGRDAGQARRRHMALALQVAPREHATRRWPRAFLARVSRTTTGSPSGRCRGVDSGAHRAGRSAGSRRVKEPGDGGQDLQGVLITAARTGIRAGHGRHLAARGWTVYATARRPSRSATCHQGLQDDRPDVCERSLMRAAVETVERAEVRSACWSQCRVRQEGAFERSRWPRCAASSRPTSSA